MQEPTLVQSEQNETIHLSLPVDPEHGGLRFAVVALFIFFAAMLYAIVSVIIPEAAGINIIGVIVGLGGSAMMIQVLDARIKSRWPSGRFLEITDQHIYLRQKQKIQNQIDASQHVNVLTWRFEITRRTRVKKGWYVVAIDLVQDDQHLPIYTFISPDEFKEMPLSKHYYLLQAKKGVESDMRKAGQEKRLHDAEMYRWNEGAELSLEDYTRYVAYLKENFPDWMLSE